MHPYQVADFGGAFPMPPSSGDGTLRHDRRTQGAIDLPSGCGLHAMSGAADVCAAEAPPLGGMARSRQRASAIG